MSWGESMATYGWEFLKVVDLRKDNLAKLKFRMGLLIHGFSEKSKQVITIV